MVNQITKLLFYRLISLLMVGALMPTSFVILLCVKSYCSDPTFLWLLSSVGFAWAAIALFFFIRYGYLRAATSPFKQLILLAENKYVPWALFLLDRLRKS